jgi:hypothetical protein
MVQLEVSLHIREECDEVATLRLTCCIGTSEIKGVEKAKQFIMRIWTKLYGTAYCASGAEAFGVPNLYSLVTTFSEVDPPGHLW